MGEIGLRGADAPFETAAVCLLLAHQDTEQGRDGQFVADEGDFFAPREDKRHVGEEAAAAKTLHREDVAPRLPFPVKADEGVAAGGRGQLFHRQFVKQFAAGRGLARFRFVGRKTGDKGLQFRDFFLCALVLLLDHALHQLAGLIPEFVVANVHPDLAVVDVHNAGADVV